MLGCTTQQRKKAFTNRSWALYNSSEQEKAPAAVWDGLMEQAVQHCRAGSRVQGGGGMQSSEQLKGQSCSTGNGDKGPGWQEGEGQRFAGKAWGVVGLCWDQ